MFIVLNVILVAAALMLILVIAATSSIPSRTSSGLDSPEGAGIGPASLPNDENPSPGSGPVALRGYEPTGVADPWRVRAAVKSAC